MKKMHEISFYYLMYPKDTIDTNDFIIYEKEVILKPVQLVGYIYGSRENQLVLKK